jgi:hypothetical protein
MSAGHHRMNPNDSIFYRTMHILEPLLREHRTLKKMDFCLLCEWVGYYWNRNTISYAINDAGKPKAVCLIKLFGQLKQFLEPFVHEPTGKFCMIELMVASDPEAMALVHDRLVGRWGAQEFVLWDRGERTEKTRPRIYRWDQFETLVRRFTHDKAATT